MFIEINDTLYSLYSVSSIQKDQYETETEVEEGTVETTTKYVLVCTFANGRPISKEYDSEEARDEEYNRLKEI